jgi:hypothetical protein
LERDLLKLRRTCHSLRGCSEHHAVSLEGVCWNIGLMVVSSVTWCKDVSDVSGLRGCRGIIFVYILCCIYIATPCTCKGPAKRKSTCAYLKVLFSHSWGDSLFLYSKWGPATPSQTTCRTISASGVKPLTHKTTSVLWLPHDRYKNILSIEVACIYILNKSLKTDSFYLSLLMRYSMRVCYISTIRANKKIQSSKICSSM